MWVPRSAREIEEAAKRGDLMETAGFDAKAQLPQPHMNVSLAVDVAAMSTGGGVLLYGVGENRDGQPTIPKPIPLAGARERIDSIVGTSLAEAPYIDVHSYPTEDDESVGYIAVVIPASPRAPHQVTVKDELRFYGRGATGNRMLLEGEIARLYERRRTWEVDREARLIEATNSSRFRAERGTSSLWAFAQPVPPDQALWDRAVERVGSEDALRDALAEAAKRSDKTGASLNGLTYWGPVGAEAWRLSSEYEPTEGNKSANYLMAIDLNIDGRGVLFAGAGAQTANTGGADRLIIFEGALAANFAAFLAFMGALFKAGGYFGPVDVGLYIAGLEGGYSNARLSRMQIPHFGDVPTFNANIYSRTFRLAAASELDDAENVARDGLRRLFSRTSGRADFDPFAP